MKTLATLCLVALFAAVAPAIAGEDVTLSGKVLCAKCTLHAEDAKGCQNVLVVGDEGAEKQYYMAKNEAYEKFGMVCTGTAAVRVTGTIKEEGGHQWIVASKIERLDDEG